MLRFLFLLLSAIVISFLFQNCAPRFQVTEPEKLGSLANDVNESGKNLELTGFGNSSYLYNYAPAVVVENDKIYMWTCSNASTPGDFRDVISFFVNNHFQNVALSNSDSKLSWDGFHVCDPSVLRGTFVFDGESYNYLMAYLGEDWNDANGDGKFDGNELSMHNQVGIAFAKAITGPWVRYPRAIITYADRLTWGIGQPSLLKSPKGNVLIFYTKGDASRTSTYWQEFDFSNINSRLEPKLINKETELPFRGLTSDSAVFIRNVDLVTDARNKMVYMLRGSERDNESYIQISSIDLQGILSRNGTWSVLKNIDSSQTTYRNYHNAGFLRTSEGTLPDENHLSVFLTGDVGTPTHSENPRIEWDYRIIEMNLELHKNPASSQPQACDERQKQSLKLNQICPAGEFGIIEQARIATCNGATGDWEYSTWQTIVNTCHEETINEVPVSITFPANNALLSSNKPTINWSYSGMATEFWMDLSESPDFSWFWNRKLPAVSRSYVYSSEGWGQFGGIPFRAPVQLDTSKKYYLRISPFKNDVIINRSISGIIAFIVKSDSTMLPGEDRLFAILEPTNGSQLNTGQPNISWVYRGSATEFWVDISESSSFNWFWNKNFSFNTRSFIYDGTNWGVFGAAPPGEAPKSLFRGTRYYLRITPFVNGKPIASEIKTLNFSIE